MVKKKKRGKVKKKIGIRKRFSRGPSWFVRSSFHPKSSWGIIPKNWKGTVSLIALIGLNVFAANYFRVTENNLDAFLKFGVVFLLSLFIFIEIAKHKTEGVKPSV